MGDPDKLREEKRSDQDPGIFEDVFPTPTHGDGNVVKNNIRSGAGQGAGSFKRKVRCQQCGFLVDIQKNDHSGGAGESGDGAGGSITRSSAEVAGGGTEYYGDQAFRKGGGCPFCYSKNSSKQNIKDLPSVRPVQKPGF